MAPIGIFIYRNRKLENANVAAAHLLGASSVEELFGRERSEFLDPEYLDEANSRWELIRRGETVPLREVEARRLDGSTFSAVVRTESVDIDGELYVITVVEDVSVETRAREALEESEEKYRSLIEFFPQGVLLSDRGTITQINPAGIRLHGATLEGEITGIDWITLVDPSFHEMMSARRDAMAAGHTLEPIEILMKRVDGSTFWGLSQAMPFNVSGKTLYMTVFDDITTRKEAEKEIEIATRELVRSNEELAQFAYVASHDLKEPLRMVSSYCDLIADRYTDALDETGKRFFYYATDGARRMQVLIDDLLLYSRIGRDGEEAGKINLNDVVGDAVQMLTEAIRVSGATLSVTDLPIVSGYRADLTRLFQNLIGNAIKFRADTALNIEIQSDRAGDALIITVSDNGIGIAPEFRERVFGIFQRLHNREKYEGTGIGLAICEKIVSQTGGRIWLEVRWSQKIGQLIKVYSAI
jgi:PAS domain S-box-containing protein